MSWRIGDSNITIPETFPFRFAGMGPGEGPGGDPADGEAFRHLVESSADAMVVVDLDGRIVYANPAAGRLFNRKAAQMRGESFGFPLTGDRPTRIDVLPRARVPRVAEMRVADTTWNGRPARVATLRDVSNRIDTERARELGAVLFSQAAEGIAFLDRGLRLLEVNAAFAEFFDSDPGWLAGRSLEQMGGELAGGESPFKRIQALGPGERWRGEMRFVTTNGRERHALVSVVHVAEEEWFRAHYVLLCADITELKRAEAALRHEARHDALTGLVNRSAFLEDVDAALSRARRKGTGLAVLFIDLDGFKQVNDQFGHDHGDVLLAQVARRMRAVVRAGDVVGRLGGDEFTVLLEDVTDPADVVAVADKLHEAIARPIDFDGERPNVGVSMGASLYPENGDRADELLARADLALYRVKAADRGGFRFFNPHMDRRVRLRREKARRLSEALESDRLYLVFQPQVDIDTGEVRAVEALLRYPGGPVGWRRPDRLVSVAEQAGLLPDLLAWVLKNAAGAALEWPGSPTVAVNICPHQLLVEGLDQSIRALVEEVGLPLSRLAVHLPVAGLMARPEQAVDLAGRLRRLGVAVWVDHFGRGSFSVEALEALSPDGVCIDRRVVAGMLVTEERRMTLYAMLAMLDSMRLPVVVQGVERAAHLDWLRGSVAELVVQGEYIAGPFRKEALKAWLARDGDISD